MCVCVLIITHVVIENHVALLVRVRERDGFSEALEPHHIARVVSPAQTLKFLRRDILGIRVLRTRNEWREMYTERRRFWRTGGASIRVSNTDDNDRDTSHGIERESTRTKFLSD